MDYTNCLIRPISILFPSGSGWTIFYGRLCSNRPGNSDISSTDRSVSCADCDYSSSGVARLLMVHGVQSDTLI